MGRREKLSQGDFKKIKDHWDICTKDGCGLLFSKDINGLETILKHCNFCHHVSDLLPSQKDKLLERLIKIDDQIEAKRY